MQDIHHEHLSSMMDGELADQDVPGFLERFQSDPHLHKKLDRYGLIRTAIRGEQMLMDHNLADRIRAALADEPTILVPRQFNWKSYRLAGAAMAASVAAVAVLLVGLNSNPQSPDFVTVGPLAAATPAANSVQTPVLAQASIATPVVDEETTVLAMDASIDPNFDAYLLNHNQNANLMQMPGMMPNVRLVSYSE